MEEPAAPHGASNALPSAPPVAPAPTALATDAAAPAAPAPVAPAPTALAPAPAPVAPAFDEHHDAPKPPVIGDGFHLFDKSYLLLGFTWQRPCSATSLELEASFVPSAFISRGLWWVGFYATAGFQTLHDQESPRPSEEAPCFSSQGRRAPVVYREWAPRGFRAGAGLEAGWRMLAVDVGALYNDTLVGRSDAEKHRELQARAERFDAPPPSDSELVPYGMRFRVGLSLADELFTGSRVKYGRQCCTKPAGENSVTACECERTPVGGSLFIYYGNELYWNGNGRWSDGMFGISLKVGIGL